MKKLPIAFVLALFGSPVDAQVLNLGSGPINFLAVRLAG
jgi:hypothetical protein